MKIIKIIFLVLFLTINIFTVLTWIQISNKRKPNYEQVFWKDKTEISYNDTVPTFQLHTISGEIFSSEDILKTEKIVLLFFRPEYWGQKEKIIQASTLALEPKIKSEYAIFAVAAYLYNEVRYPESIKLLEDKSLKLHKIFKPSERGGATIIISSKHKISFATDHLASFQDLKNKLKD